MIVQEHFNDLVIATYGRGFWILDDLSPLQKMTPEVLASDAHLFAPRATYRFRTITGNYATNDDPTAGTNPPYGAGINYWLRTAPATGTAVTVSIADATGKTVRTIQGTRQAGINRVYWDLENTPSRTPRMRTKPAHFPEFTMSQDGTREAAGFGNVSVLMPPGRYTVKLTIGDREYTQPLEVRKDPHSSGTEQDIRAQTEIMLRIQDEHAAAGDLLTSMEDVRAEILRLTSDSARSPAEIRTSGAALDQKLIVIEEKLQDLRLTGRGQDGVRWPTRLGGQISYLSSGIASSDYAPTAQQGEVQRLLAEELRNTRAAFEKFAREDLARFNARLTALGLQQIIAKLPGVIF
jgi:hypothetical protein